MHAYCILSLCEQLMLKLYIKILKFGHLLIEPAILLLQFSSTMTLNSNIIGAYTIISKLDGNIDIILCRLQVYG